MSPFEERQNSDHAFGTTTNAGLCSLDPLVGRYINPEPGDSFVKNGKTVSVISVTPTWVTWDYKHGDCLHYETSSREEWAVLVQKTMAHGATFVPANH